MFIYQTSANTASSIRRLEPYHTYVKVPVLFYTRTPEQCTAIREVVISRPAIRRTTSTEVKRDFAITAQGL